MYVVLSIGVCLFSILLFCVYRRNRGESSYRDKKVLIVGGSSGLGLALALDLKSRGAEVTITSRSSGVLSDLEKKHGLTTQTLDITDQRSVEAISTECQIVFCCAGICIPALAEKITVEKIQKCMETNFYGAVRVFLHFLPRCSAENRKKMVFIASTLAYHSFAGYAAYSPSKAALRSFFEAVKEESKIKGLDLAIYYVSTIDSPGLAEEDKTKPEITKKIEGASRGPETSAENRAKHLLNSLPGSEVVISDIITRFFSQSTEIHSLKDYFVWRVAPVFWLVFKAFSRYHTKNHFKRKSSAASKSE